jgi:hypothetical protein
LKPKGVTLGKGNKIPNGERRELKKATGNRCNIPIVIAKVRSDGGDCIEDK